MVNLCALSGPKHVWFWSWPLVSHSLSYVKISFHDDGLPTFMRCTTLALALVLEADSARNSQSWGVQANNFVSQSLHKTSE